MDFQCNVTAVCGLLMHGGQLQHLVLANDDVLIGASSCEWLPDSVNIGVSLCSTLKSLTLSMPRRVDVTVVSGIRRGLRHLEVGLQTSQTASSTNHLLQCAMPLFLLWSLLDGRMMCIPTHSSAKPCSCRAAASQAARLVLPDWLGEHCPAYAAVMLLEAVVSCRTLKALDLVVFSGYSDFDTECAAGRHELPLHPF